MALTEDQIIKGFWHHDRARQWPPDPITTIGDYSSSERLNLGITQLDVSSYQQGKIIDRWCRDLPELDEVRYLWFSSRVNQKMFEAACRMPNLEGLYIHWSGIKQLDSITRLRKLKHFWLGSSSQVESIEPLGQMGNLVTLETENLKRITDFSILSKLVQLEGVGIDGSIWGRQVIDTLAPLAALINLKYLTLTNTRVRDQSLEPLLSLKKLVRFNSAWYFPESEFDKLKNLPNLKYGNVETSWNELKNLLGKSK